MNIRLQPLSHLSSPGFAGVAARVTTPRTLSSPSPAPSADLALPTQEQRGTSALYYSSMPTAEQLTQLRYAGMAQAIDRLTATQKKPI